MEHVVKIVSLVAQALYYAHNLRGDDKVPLGIIHRDVSHQNILLSQSGEVKLVDFGIAKAAGRIQQTAVGVLKGKHAFMAPEQRTETRLDPRADVYAVGVMLAAMLGGYPGPKGPVGDLLDRCLSENPGGRPRDAQELGQLVTSIRLAEARKEEYLRDLKRVAELAEGG